MSSTGTVLSPNLAEAIAQCAKEPIQYLGSIQSHGAVLVVNLGTEIVSHASANIADWLGVSADEVIGTRWDRWMRLENALNISQFLSSTDSPEPRTFLSRVCGEDSRKPPLALDGFLVTATVSDRILLELTPIDSVTSPLGTSIDLFYDSIRSFFKVESLDDFHSELASFVRKTTGFDRVKVYQFDMNWNGKVVAESKTDEVESFLGMHFPASDIPAQARSLYSQTPARAISDVNGETVPLIPACGPSADNPIDLSNCGLRSVSPVHLVYLRNMGVGASLSISLMHENRLWGLIACHHMSPRSISTGTMQIARVISSIASSQLSLRYEAESLRIQSKLTSAISVVRNAPLNSNSFPDFIWEELQGFGKTIEAPAIFACLHGHIQVTSGHGLRELGTSLIEYLQREAADQTVYSTASLPMVLTMNQSLRDIACGLLAIRIGRDWTNAVFFFRPEQRAMVTWAGRVDGSGGKDIDDHGILVPRASFEAWSNQVELTSKPFLQAEERAVVDLRSVLTDIVIHQSDRALKKLVEDLGERNAEMEDFVHSISHDLKTPLVTIDGFSTFLQEAIAEEDHESALKHLERIQLGSSQLQRTIMGLIEINKARRVAKSTSHVSIREALEKAIEFQTINVIGDPFKIELSGDFGDVAAHPGQLKQVFDNILGNAVKFGLTKDCRTIRVIGERLANGTLVRICDEGPGIPAKYADQAFKLFGRLHDKQTPGTGVGLALVHRVMRSLEGEIWINTGVESGAEFVMRFPAP
ncbi:MAG: ATP-binding protein [Phycisphaerales bacterium]